MLKIQKGVVLIACVLVITGLVYYQYAAKIFQTPKPDATAPSPVVEEKKLETQKLVIDVPAGSRALSAVVSYDVPGDNVDTVKITLVVDKDGVISQAVMVDAKTETADEHQLEFNKELTTVIKGKKLADLKAVDRIGKSSLTTTAFNSVIDELQAAL